MANIDTIVIVGAGLAGVSAAGALRDVGFAGRVVLLGDEAEAPYDRPPLSKAVLVSSEFSSLDGAGAQQRLEVPANISLRPTAWYEQHRIECLLGEPVLGIDTAAHAITTEKLGSLRYNRLLLTTGARARRLPAIETGATPHLYLRSLHDAVALRKHLQPGRRIVLLGGGVIGMEVAASARTLGCEVTVLELAPRIMARALPAPVSDHVANYHRSKDVNLQLAAEVMGPGPGNAGGLLLKDGTIVPADLIVIGIGVVPNIELAAAAGITCRDGIVVDKYGATSASDVYAAGDAVRYPDAFLGIELRGENWMHAQNHAVAVAKNALGAREPYREIPFMWSDQYDLKIQITGRFDTSQHVLRGDPAGNRFMWLHLTDNKIQGASGINLARDMRFVQRLIDSGAVVDPRQLGDPNFNLKTAASG